MRRNLPRINAHHPENPSSFARFTAKAHSQTNQHPVESALGRNIDGFENIPVDQLNRRACGGARLSWISTPESIGAFLSK